MSNFKMHLISLFMFVLFTFHAHGQSYSLRIKWDASNMFNAFDFKDFLDPNNGFVSLLNHDEAISAGLASTPNDTFGPGTLLVGDFEHITSSICGVWPSFFTINDDEDLFYREIDILESSSLDTKNIVSLHTDERESCVFNSGDQTGSFLNRDCSLKGGNSGCEVEASDSTTGDGFNNGGGSVYAMALESNSIRVWHFRRNNIPSDLSSEKPNVGNWPKPIADLDRRNGGCDVGKLFTRQNTVIKIDLCGEHSDAIWSSQGCARRTGASSCRDYVKNNPKAFSNAYFLINSVKVFGR
ncbi:mixed-linked glucanase [Tothia fuscella]|uniref:Mixed-linked glucanase n=1 Tax=Tothia fuscella TaxID=1048955 RepID=A0A9P4NSL9_9PEZI|nr:mixed-linked glucanase [Tothia fuscella]